MTDDDKRAEYIRGMRALMDVLEANPEIPLPYHGTMTAVAVYFNGLPDAKQLLAAAAKAIPCSWEKKTSESGEYDWLELHGNLHGLRLVLEAFRDDVCERIVLGTEDREVEEVVQPAVIRKITKPVEVVEWRCAPLMSALDEQEGQA